MARNWIRKLRFPEGRLFARVPESVCGRMGARTFSPWFLRIFTKWKNSIGILLRSGCCQLLKMQNRHREVSCVVQGHMSCQWPTISRKGRSSPRATQLRSNPSERVGEVLTHLLSGPLGAKVHPHASVGDAETMGVGEMDVTGTGTLLATSPNCLLPQSRDLFLKVPGRPQPKGDDKDVPGPVYWGRYRGQDRGRLLAMLICFLCKLKAQGNFKERERDKKPNKIGPKTSWNYVVFCSVAGDPVTDACDYGLCKQLSEKFIRCSKAAEEQMWN